jgi:hypothetical protein
MGAWGTAGDTMLQTGPLFGRDAQDGTMNDKARRKDECSRNPALGWCGLRHGISPSGFFTLLFGRGCWRFVLWPCYLGVHFGALAL